MYVDAAHTSAIAAVPLLEPAWSSILWSEPFHVHGQVSPVHSAGSPPRVNEAGIRDGSQSVDMCWHSLQKTPQKNQERVLETFWRILRVFLEYYLL
jgi:hypothetical protein